MNDARTARLLLHPVDEAEARRIAARSPGPTDRWVEDFPFDGDLAALGGFLRATAAHGEQRPFGYYRVDRLVDGRAIGGIGFKGRPNAGCVEIGYGLAPSARGHGYAAEAIGAVLGIATSLGLSTVVAETTPDNVASQRSLTRAGFHLVDTDGDRHRYRTMLGAGVQDAGRQ